MAREPLLASYFIYSAFESSADSDMPSLPLGLRLMLYFTLSCRSDRCRREPDTVNNLPQEPAARQDTVAALQEPPGAVAHLPAPALPQAAGTISNVSPQTPFFLQWLREAPGKAAVGPKMSEIHPLGNSVQ